ncbi:MAG: reverse transcriptase domain-containing protein [Crocinitomicaceae bacterium]
MDVDSKQIVEITIDDFLKTDLNSTRLKFNALKLLFELDIPKEFGFESYVKHVIPKKDGTNRILYEPKPLLKEIQRQLLNLLYTLQNHRDYSPLARKVKSNYLPTKSSTAYFKGCSVVKNANFHIDKDVLLKLDISNFFNSIPKNNVESFWTDILTLKAKYLVHLGILEKDEQEENKRLIIKGLVTKVLSATTLNGFLPQGSPTSGHIANSYLASFDKRMLEYCLKKSLSYSRYSDDITISGSNSDLTPDQVIKFVQFQLHKKSLKLKKAKTKVLKRHKRQTVTGIVVNEKRSAGRTYKRGLRMEMYFLKKFGSEHILRTHSNIIHYLQELAGKINWVLQVNKVDPEFKRYKGELSIIKRFIHSRKSISEAINYINSLDSEQFEVKNNAVFVAGLFWRISDDETQNDLPSLVRRNKSLQFFTEEGIDLALKNNPGWRLPTAEEFKNYIQETNYDDRRALGIRYSFDPHFNGLADERGFRYYNRVGLYWTSDLDHLPKEQTTKDRIARKAICFLSFEQKLKKKLNLKTARNISNKVFTLSVNKKQKFETSKNRPIEYYLDPTFNDDVNSISGACSIRLVKSTIIEQKQIISKAFWDSIQASKFSVDLSKLKIQELPFPLKNYNASSILLSNNKIKQIDLTEIPPVKRIDLSNNDLETIDLKSIPNGVKHIRLEGNRDLKMLEIPWKRMLRSSHEFTTDEKFLIIPESIDQIYLSALGGEGWLLVSNDQELDELILAQKHIDFLKVKIVIGSNEVDTKELFNRLNRLKVSNLFIELETIQEQLNKLIQELKMSFSSNQTIKEQDWNQENIFIKEYFFNASDLKNQGLKSLILDLSWLPNIKFNGDFEIKPDIYHLLHPGTSFTSLPATSSEFHRPNILIKILGERQIDDESTSLIVHYPLSLSIKSRHQKIQTVIPKNQLFIDDLILVVSSGEKREQQVGQIEEHFPKSHSIKRFNSQEQYPKSSIKLISSKRVSGFPLLGFALLFDVHKLSVPLESFYKTDRILFHPNRYKNQNQTGSVLDWTGLDFNKLIYSEKKTRLSSDNQLSELDIFSHKTKAIYHTIPQASNQPTNRPYVIKKGMFAKHALYSSSLESRKKVLTMLETGEIEAKHLPSKLKNDEEVMLVAIKRNPYSMVFASRRLKENTNFLLRVCEISLRTLVFLPKKLANEIEEPNSALNQIVDYLISSFKPVEYNFIIHKLGTHIAVADGEYPHFTCEATAKYNSQVIFSFDLEGFYQDKTVRAGMPNAIRNAFLNQASKRGIFNNNGYYNSLEIALQNKDDCTHLDLSFSGSHNDLTFLELFKNLKILNLSYTSVSCNMPYLPFLETLYVDYVRGFFIDNGLTFLSSQTPNLRVIIGKETFFHRVKDLLQLLSLFPKIEKLDIRPYFYPEDEEILGFQEQMTQQGRVVDIPIKNPN